MWRTVWTLVKGAAPALLIATLVPMALFWVMLTVAGIGYAIGVSVVYAYGAAAAQFLKHRRISGMLLVTVFMASMKALAVVLSGKAAVYFAIPAVETAGFGLTFLVTMFTAEPLVVRLARDLVPHAAQGITERRSLVRTLSWAWTLTYVGSGVTTLVLLSILPLPVFLGVHTVTGWCWTGTGTLVSAVLCRTQARGLLAGDTARTAPATPGRGAAPVRAIAATPA